MRSPIFSFFCLAGAIGWACLMFYWLMFFPKSDASRLALYLPSVVLLILFACCFRFIKDSALEFIAILVYGLLGLSLLILFNLAPFGLVLALPVSGYGYAAYRLLFRKGNNT